MAPAARSALWIGLPEAVEAVLTAYRNTLQADASELVGLGPNARWPGGRFEDTRSVYGDDRMLALALESPYPIASSLARPDLDDHVAHPASALFDVVLGPLVAGFVKEPPVQEQVVGVSYLLALDGPRPVADRRIQTRV